MINFKKADAYFRKVLDRGERLVKWAPDEGFVWLVSDHVAMLYPEESLPLNPARVPVSPILETVIKNAAASDEEIQVTSFIWSSGKASYCVLSGRRLIKKEFVHILNTDLLVGSKNVGIYSAFDSGQLVGFACGHRGPEDMWEALK